MESVFLRIIWMRVSSVTQSCPTLCNPMDYTTPGSSVHGIVQARILSGLPFPSPGDLPDPGIEPGFLALQTDSLPTELREVLKSIHLTPDAQATPWGVPTQGSPLHPSVWGMLLGSSGSARMECGARARGEAGRGRAPAAPLLG